jgi:hypothetical protein
MMYNLFYRIFEKWATSRCNGTSLGEVVALITAIGVSTLFISFATETYAVALKTIGSLGMELVIELQKLHRRTGEAGGFRCD